MGDFDVSEMYLGVDVGEDFLTDAAFRIFFPFPKKRNIFAVSNSYVV